METETIDKLFLELSQVTNAKTARELKLEDLLRSACNIAERQGADTHWQRFIDSVNSIGLNGVTARTYKVLPSDKNDVSTPGYMGDVTGPGCDPSTI